MGTNTYYRRGGTIRALAWISAALGAAVLVTVVLATRGGAIQQQLGEAGQRLKDKLPGLPKIPQTSGSPSGAEGQPPAADPGTAPSAAPGTAPGTQTAPGAQGQPAAPQAPQAPADPAGQPKAAPATRPYTVDDPPPVVQTRHKVKQGETLYTLAETYYENGSLWKLIAKANGLKDPSDLREGMELTIPGR
jgi:nucleoid-associated protein YgaU